MDGEWKERGLGQIKVLRDETNPLRSRIVMRREPVMKVCCNHDIKPDVTFDFHKNGKNFVTWAARDFSEEDHPGGVDEIFLAKFKNEDVAKRFLDAARTAAEAAKSYKSPVKPAAPAAPVVSAEKKNEDANKPAAGGFSFAGFKFTAPPKVALRPSGHPLFTCLQAYWPRLYHRLQMRRR